MDEGERYENLSLRAWARNRQQQQQSSSTISGPHIKTAPLQGKPCSLNSLPTPLSEPELSTDESVSSEDGDAVAIHELKSSGSFGSCNNAFHILTDRPFNALNPTQHLQQLVRDVHECFPASLSHAVVSFTDDDETVHGSDTRGTGTPLSTTGTITPHFRSRANSVCISPRSQSFMAKPDSFDHPNVSAPQKTEKPTVRLAQQVRAQQEQLVQQTSAPLAETANLKLHVPVFSEKPSAPVSRANRRQRSHRSQENLSALQRTRSGVIKAGLLNMSTLEDKPKQDKPKKKGKILFTVGGDSEEEEVPQDDDDAWSSEDEDDNAQSKANLEAEKMRQKEEEERERMEMFKKRPIRSVSLADLPHASSSMQSIPAPEGGATRGLLSSMLKPPETSSRLSRKGRARSGHTLQFSQMPTRNGDSSMKDTRNTSVPSEMLTKPTTHMKCMHRSASSGLTRSKSAIAMPLLNLTSLHSCTSSGRMPVSPVSATSESARTMSNQGSESDESNAAATTAPHPPQPTRSNMALSRLSAIAQRKSFDGGDGRKLTSLMRSYSAIGNLMTSTHRPPSPQNASQSTADEDDFLSLGVRADEQGPMRVERVPQPHMNSVMFADAQYSSPDVMSTERQQTPTMASDVSTPLSSRTNADSQSKQRAAVFNDELSQSLRDNLLWQRRSRERMLGLYTKSSADGSEPAQSPRYYPRRTSTSALPLNSHDDEGSFHHKGW